MPITEGWCVEAKCDRCGASVFVPYSAKVSSVEQVKRMGWRVDGRVLCPGCAALSDRAERMMAERKGRPRGFGKGKRGGKGP